MGGNIDGRPWRVFESTLSNIAADQMLSFTGSNGKSNVNIDLFDEIPDWNRIDVEVNITSLTGTSVNIIGYTSNDVDGGALTSSSVAAKKHDGSTAFASGAISAAGKTMFSTLKKGATTSSNIGALLAFGIDVSTVTDCDGSVIVTISKE